MTDGSLIWILSVVLEASRFHGNAVDLKRFEIGIYSLDTRRSNPFQFLSML
jgi:hypothetical protein